jgi:hypothetical protein
LWEFVNRESGSPNSTGTSNIHLQVENEIVTSPSRICNIFNKTFIETVRKLMLDKKPPHTSDNITYLKDSFVLLEITDRIDQNNPKYDILIYLLKNVYLT